jgi:hypothetical protein
MLRAFAIFADLTPKDRERIRQGYREAQADWFLDDSRHDFRGNMHALLGELVEAPPVEADEREGLCWAIGRDLRLARLRPRE